MISFNRNTPSHHLTPAQLYPTSHPSTIPNHRTPHYTQTPHPHASHHAPRQTPYPHAGSTIPRTTARHTTRADFSTHTLTLTLNSLSHSTHHAGSTIPRTTARHTPRLTPHHTSRADFPHPHALQPVTRNSLSSDSHSSIAFKLVFKAKKGLKISKKLKFIHLNTHF